MSFTDGETPKNTWEPPDTDFIVTSVNFGVDSIAISYIDMRLSSDIGSAEVVLQLSDKEHYQVIIDIKDAVRDIIDGYHVYARQPPDSLEAGASRLRARREAVDHEETDG